MDTQSRIIADHAAAPVAPVVTPTGAAPAPAAPTALGNIEQHVATFLTNVRAEIALAVVVARAEGVKVAAEAHAALDAAKARVAEVEQLAKGASTSSAVTTITADVRAVQAAGGIVPFLKAHKGELIAIAIIAGACAVAVWKF